MTPPGRRQTARLPDRRQLRKLQPPAGARGERVHVLQRVEVDDEAGVGGLVQVHELGLALDEVAAGQVIAEVSGG